MNKLRLNLPFADTTALLWNPKTSSVNMKLKFNNMITWVDRGSHGALKTVSWVILRPLIKVNHKVIELSEGI